ncbi:glycosyltransferase 61 family protein [Poseidonocella sp. HB161398]|uniref:glycosyltransferase 61 family protein n=1 Tax=Poseidonocella sp. HB161398 TaxID=2320855 RepID=UPI001109F9A9|nr:glycosyltransferase 61 family protein [Poseidonocella sp. HB161398]
MRFRLRTILPEGRAAEKAGGASGADLPPAAPPSPRGPKLIEKLASDAFLRSYENILVEPATAWGWPAGPVWPPEPQPKPKPPSEAAPDAAAPADGTPAETAPETPPPGLQRHWVNGHAVLTPPETSGREPEVIEGPCVWAGALMGHFGHFVAEHCQRLLFSRMLMPKARYIFTLPEGRGVKSVPSYFWHLCDWFEVPREQILFLTDRPLLVRELHVLRQGEQLERINLPFDVIHHEWCGPLPEYLQALAELHKVKEIDFASGGTVYVSRSQLAPLTVRMPGESYLEKRLQDLGVTVIWPEKSPLAEQIEAYATAKRIIFAEGSSVHVRQFLGYLPQDLCILVRRKGARFGREHLEPRAKSLSYIDPIACNVLFTVTPDGSPSRHTSIPIFDQDLLLQQFAEFGIDLAPVWDRAAYERAHDRDLADWVRASCDEAGIEGIAHGINIMNASLLGSGRIEYMPKLRRVAMMRRRGLIEQRDAEASGKAGTP